MTDDYYRRRIDEAAIAAENARAARMAALQEALLLVLRDDLDVLDQDTETPALRAALVVVNDLRHTW